MNYIGSKHTLLPFLTETIDNVVGEKSSYIFADLFAGTGVVGAEFRRRGCSVISNDIQSYSYILNKHLIENTAPDISLTDKLNDVKGVEGFVYKNYCAGSGSGRNYFSDYNGKKCDAIRQKLDIMKQHHNINDEDFYFCLASLINSVDKCANTASVYGAFLKNIKQSAAKDFLLEPIPVIEGRPGKVYKENINELIKKVTGDVLYLDPPYNTRQYCTNYHVLETIALYDNPQIRGKTGLRDYSNQKSEYCSKRTVAAAFDDLLKNAHFKYIFLSYNNEGLMSLEEIRSIMRRYGKYEVFTTGYKRFRADKEEKRNHKASSTVEYLHCLIK